MIRTPRHLADRYKLLGRDRGGEYGYELDGGRRVRFPRVSGPFFIDGAEMETLARVVDELDDPRVAKIIEFEPLVIEAPPEQKPSLRVEQWVDCAIELVDVASLLRRRGVAHSRCARRT